MPVTPQRGPVLLLTPDAGAAQSLLGALAARAIAAEHNAALPGALAYAYAALPSLVVLDTRLVAEPGDLRDLVRRFEPATDEEPRPPFVVWLYDDDLAYRLAAMRARADAIIPVADNSDGMAARIASLLGAVAPGPSRVLVIDDQPVSALFTSRVLQGAGMTTERVTDPAQVRPVLERLRPDLVLMDLRMPSASGIELTGLIRGDDRFTDLPIIYLSSELDPSVQFAALRVGGDDFLSKPVSPDRLLGAVDDCLKRARERQRRREGPDGLDRLTRLATRERLLKRIDWLLGQAYSAQVAATELGIQRGCGPQRAVIYLEILGIQESLELAAAEVSRLIRPGDLAARVSDRAIAVLATRDTHQVIAELAQRLVFAVGKLLQEKTMGADVGGGWYPLTGACKDSTTLVSRASKAARWSLRGGAPRIGRYETARSTDDDEERQLAILDAVRFQRVELLYEPMVALTGISGERYEITPRLLINDGEVLLPSEFLPAITAAGLAASFDRWLLGAGLDVLKSKMAAEEPVLLFIHQSLYGLEMDDWVYWVRDQINQRDLIRLRPVLQFEIGEADKQLELAIKRARQLARLGIRVCLNGLDFSERSMRVLHSVPSGYVRISRRVIHGPDADSIAWLIQSIKACGARVIATGVDGPAAITKLLSVGVDLIQGPYIQPPGTEMDLDPMVEEDV